MIKAVMVKCYLLCLLTLTLCCASGLVWADSPKDSDALIKPSTVGGPSLVHRAIPAQENENWLLHEHEDEDGDQANVIKVHGSERSSGSSQVEPDKQQIPPPPGSFNSRPDLGPNRPGLSTDPGSPVNRSPDEQNSQISSGHEKTQEEDQLTRSPKKEGDPSKEQQVTAGQTETSAERVSNIGGQGGSQLPELPEKQQEQQQEQQQGAATQDSHTPTNTVDTTKGKGSTDGNRTSVATTDKTSEISPNNSEVKNADGSDAANTESDVTSSGSVSSNKQEGDAVNTDTPTTTTTTTALPPELTNNKKGDADSSSSISSSVWVRVPLLIVFTLACIVVC
ncbi:uncharacterized protein TM35_001031050 [Trypanosoma theileri]|uniref:Mucin-associated surface protein (MASP) n=1 Tax=Trypanosoma theileri TaxID=67003 RepID=A0A1X0NES6_9TRYP|nr:uncharacterized protein TM35_001031050 [Trypanosoma theileri]ORC81930.1 hypothetical protein TM35_001031050 [Trypanosoma theileri]